MILAHDVVGEPSDGDPGAAELWLLHGILGSGRNWRAFGRRLSRSLPGWRVVTVDLRGHGDSHPAPPPHTLVACARDLDDLAAARGGAPAAVIGHSFGGKVALAWASTRPSGLRRAWVLDAAPGPQPRLMDHERWVEHEVGRVVLALEALPGRFPSIEAATGALAEQGLSKAITAWMTTNLEREGEALRWRFDLDVVRELLLDHARTDGWPWVTAAVGLVRLLKAEHSDRWVGVDGEGYAALVARGHALELQGAGHWVHVDAPDALATILLGDLRGIDADPA